MKIFNRSSAEKDTTKHSGKRNFFATHYSLKQKLTTPVNSFPHRADNGRSDFSNCCEHRRNLRDALFYGFFFF